MNKFKNFIKSKVAKAFAAVGFGVAGATNAVADVSYTAGTGFSGSIDLTPFYSAVTIIIVVLGAIYAVKTGLSLFKK